jgi:chemotaxis protein CheD
VNPALRQSADPVAPEALAGFEHVRRYFDANLKRWTAQVVPGEFYVTPHDEVLTTVLGSCVSVCMRDPDTGVGGMNHFLLPGETGTTARRRATASSRSSA